MPEVRDRALPNIAIMPGLGSGGFGQQVARAGIPFRSQSFDATSIYVTGITRDSAGAALGGCIVQLFRTVDDAPFGETTSDGAGNYSIVAPVGGPFYLVAYKAGAPDVAGTTVNTLIPV